MNYAGKIAVAAVLVAGLSGAGIRAMAQQDEARPQYEHNGAQTQRTDPDTYANRPDYSNSEYYRTGNDEGYQDYKAHKQRATHEHKYRDDNDRKAHDDGYKEGWSGHSYRDSQTDRGTQTNTRTDTDKHDKDDYHDTH